MSRDLSVEFLAAAESDTLYLGLLVSIEFSSDTSYMWSGYGNLDYDGNTYIGLGHLGTVTPIGEINDVSAKGITLNLNGIPSSLVSALLTQARQGRDIVCHLGLFNKDGTLIDVAEDVFKGLADVPTIVKGADGAYMTYTAENRLIELQKPNVRRYTDEDQKELFPNDKGLEYVVSIQDKNIEWGG